MLPKQLLTGGRPDASGKGNAASRPPPRGMGECSHSPWGLEARGGVMQPLGLHFTGWGNATILPGAPEARGGVMQPLGVLFGGWGNAAILPGAPEAEVG